MPFYDALYISHDFYGSKQHVIWTVLSVGAPHADRLVALVTQDLGTGYTGPVHS